MIGIKFNTKAIDIAVLVLFCLRLSCVAVENFTVIINIT